MSVLESNWTLSAQESAAAVDGKLELIGGGGLTDSVFHGVGTDTRVDLSSLLFFALVGDAHDAHRFLKDAISKNAAGLVVHRALTPEEVAACEEQSRISGMPVAIILVKDTLLALQQLSRHWRMKCPAMVLGITGTNGKTSTKEFAAAIISSRFKVQWSKGSFNNHWGVPISLLSIRPNDEVAVIEMGMNHIGELKTLSRLVEANAVVCTMVGRGHLEGVGSVEGVALAKSEIYSEAPRTATFIFNLDNEHTVSMMSRFAAPSEEGRSGRRTVTFGAAAGDVSLRVTSMDADSIHIEGEIRGVEGHAVIPVYGKHNVTNLMAAASLALVAGMSPQEIWKALPLCRSAWGRNQWVHLKSGARAMFDGYNANPESMQAALENAKLLSVDGRRVAVLGEMRELGDFAASAHEELGRLARDVGFAEVIFLGPSAGDFARGFESVDGGAKVGAPGGASGGAPVRAKSLLKTMASFDPAVAADLKTRLVPGDFVLIKGSRGMSLETFLKGLDPTDFKSK